MKKIFLFVIITSLAACSSENKISFSSKNESPEELGKSIAASLITGTEKDFMKLICSPHKYKDLINNYRNLTPELKERYWKDYGDLMEEESITDLDSLNQYVIDMHSKQFKKTIIEGKEEGILDWSKVKFLRTTYSWNNDSDNEYYLDTDVFNLNIQLQDKNYLYFISCGSLIYDEDGNLLLMDRIKISEPKIFLEALNY